MRQCGPLTALLVLATLAVDLPTIFALRGEPGHHWPHAPLPLLLALIFSQVSLVAMWVGLARRPMHWPLAALVGLLLVWGAVLADPGFQVIPGWFGTLGWPMVLSLQAIAVVGPLWMARWVGVRVETAAGFRPLDRPDPDRPIQFSIAFLLGWITLVAVFLGLCRWMLLTGWLRPDSAGWGDAEDWKEIALVVAGNAVLAWPLPWAVLGTRLPLLRGLVGCLAVVAVIGTYELMDISAAYHVAFRMLFLAQAGLLAGSLAIVRIDGYRLIGRRT